MSKLKLIVAIALLLCFNNSSMAQTTVAWKEKEAFHKIMSQTFHPVEKGDFNPIRQRSGEMVTIASNWKKSAIPAGFTNKKQIKKNLKALVSGSKKLDKKIHKKADDEVIKKDLIALHDVFHNIVGLCTTED